MPRQLHSGWINHRCYYLLRTHIGWQTFSAKRDERPIHYKLLTSASARACEGNRTPDRALGLEFKDTAGLPELLAKRQGNIHFSRFP